MGLMHLIGVSEQAQHIKWCDSEQG